MRLPVRIVSGARRSIRRLVGKRINLSFTKILQSGRQQRRGWQSLARSFELRDSMEVAMVNATTRRRGSIGTPLDKNIIVEWFNAPAWAVETVGGKGLVGELFAKRGVYRPMPDFIEGLRKKASRA